MTSNIPTVDHVTISTPTGIPEGLLLKTKLVLPTPRETTIARPPLIQLLDRGVLGKLTVLTAPPGFGKTTLLSSWARHTAHNVAWVALDPRDNDPIRFWTYVIAAIDTSHPGVGTTAFTLLHAAQAAPIEMTLTALLNAVTALSTPITLVLDDCHSITTAGIYDLLAFFIEHLPPQLHLVLASRVVPPLNLARLRANGEVTDIRAEQLRFSLSETTTLLNQVLGLALPPGDVATLETRTEGWIAGLRLAAAALQNQPDPAAFVANLRGSHRFVLDYLMEEVLALLSPAHQQFLFQTSMLERLTADLCNAVTEQSDGQEWLQTLEQANLFIEPLDEERRWYRYHQLFAEFLRAAFQRSDPSGGTAVHRRAATWFIAHGMLADALYHVLAAGDMELAADLVEQLAFELLEQGEVVTLKTWISAIPTTIIHARPRLALFYAWSQLGSTQHAATLFWIDVVEVGIAQQAATLDQADIQVMQSELEIIHAIVDMIKGDFAASATRVHHARALLTMQHTWLRNWMVHIDAVSYLVQGELAMAREILAAEPLSSISGANQRLPDHMAGMYATMYMNQGQFKAALALYEQLLQHDSVRKEGQHPIRASSIYTGLSSILYEHNNLAQARHFAQRNYDFGQSNAFAFATMKGLLLLAQVQWAENDIDGARASLRSVEQHFAQAASSEPLHLHVVSTCISFWAKRRDIVATRHWIALYTSIQRTNRIETPPPILYVFPLDLALARLALLEEQWAEAHTRLDALIEAAEPRGWGWVVLEARVLQALAWQAQGDREQAVTVAIQALTFAAPEGFVRLFLDEGDAMRRLLLAALPVLQRQREEALAAYVFSLLAAFGSPDQSLQAATPATPRASADTPHTPALIEPLTDRETEVLHLIAAGMSNQEIAQTLMVGVGTIKTHLISIYGKLGVHKRTQAVARARELHLL